MALNFPGPYEIRLKYTVTGEPGGAVEHQFRHSLNCSPLPTPGDDPSEIYFLRHDTTTTDMQSYALALWNVMEDFFEDDKTSASVAELWKYAPQSFEATYVATTSIGLPGTSSTGFQRAGETIHTFRTLEGGIFKTVMLDTIGAVAEPQEFSQLNSVNIDWVDFFTNPEKSCALGRDTSRPIAFLRQFVGQNEHLFKQRYGR